MRREIGLSRMWNSSSSSSLLGLSLLLLLVCCNVLTPATARPSAEVEGPGREAAVVEDSDRLAVEGLPMEHRHVLNGPIVLPDTRGISESVYEQLGVDLFFSMWFVFLNNKVTYSDAPFTILASVNSSRTTPEILLQDESLAEEVITNHFLLGEEIRPERLLQPEVRYTAGGQRLNFKIDKNGELWVNNVRIVGWTKVGKGIILALSDYLYTEHIEPSLLPRKSQDADDDESDLNKVEEDPEKTTPKAEETKDTTTASTTTVTTTTSTTSTTVTSTTVTATTTAVTTTTTVMAVIPDHWIMAEKCKVVKEGNSMFKSIVFCVEEFVDPESAEGKEALKKKAVVAEESQKKDVRKEDEVVRPTQLFSSEKLQQLMMMRKNDSLPDFLKDIVNVLTKLNLGCNEFLGYLKKANIEGFFKDGHNYTALIPYDGAFRAWYPIDWGFNPFEVDSFVRETMLNSFIEGSIDQMTVTDGAKFETLGGKEVTFTKHDGKVKVNGVTLVDWLEVAEGEGGGRPSVFFLDQLLFVNHSEVAKLNKEYAYLESGPLLPVPWNKSQFLSHAFHILTEREEFTYMGEYMNATEELGNYGHAYNGTNATNGYTLFAPRDDAFFRILLQDATAPDPFLLDKEFRLEMLLNQMAVGRLFWKDLVPGKMIRTVGNKTLSVQKVGDEISLNDGKQAIKIVGNETYVYNLGNIFFVDKVLFVETSDVVKVMEKYKSKYETVAEDTTDEFKEDFGSKNTNKEKEDVKGKTEEEVKKEKEEEKKKIEKKKASTDDTKIDENKGDKELPRGTRKEDEESFSAKGATLEFPEGFDESNVEEKVIFVNNQKISILKQKAVAATT